MVGLHWPSGLLLGESVAFLGTQTVFQFGERAGATLGLPFELRPETGRAFGEGMFGAAAAGDLAPSTVEGLLARRLGNGSAGECLDIAGKLCALAAQSELILNSREKFP